MVDRLDMVVGSFPVWTEHLPLVSESGKNPLFTNGQKEAVNLRVTLDYSEPQQAAVKALCDQYPVTKAWDLNNVHPEA